MSHGLYLAVRAAHVGVESSERETKQFKIFFLGVVQIPDSGIRIPGPDPDPDPDRQFAWYGWLGE